MQNSTCKNPATIGVCRETISIWERRTPLSPQGCKDLIESGLKVIIQPSKQRCFTDSEYLAAGCIIQEDLSDCKAILSINQVDEKHLLNEKTYMFYSNCINFQFMKMPLLRKINDLKIRLIDYECIREIVNVETGIKTSGKTIINFDNLKSLTGTINILKAVGDLLLSKEISTPLLFTKPSYMYPTMQSASEALKLMATYIIQQELPSDITPFIIAIIGNDTISICVEDYLKLLPNKRLSVPDLLNENYEKRNDLIFYVVLNYEDIYSHLEGKQFSFEHFRENPENYESKFVTKFFCKFSVIINCLYWERRYPKILNNSVFQKNIYTNEPLKLLGICDMTGSLNGAIGFLEEFSSNKKPYHIYDIKEKRIVSSFEENLSSIVYHVSPLTLTSFAIDASIQFSDLLVPYIKDLAKSNYPESDNDFLKEEIRMATITSNGSLTKKYVNLFESSLEYEKINKTRHRRTPLNHQNFVSLKLQGHLIQKGTLKKLVYNLNKYNVDFDIIYLKIGEINEDESILYIDLYSETSELIMIFLVELKGYCNLYCCKCLILKHNITEESSSGNKVKELLETKIDNDSIY
jgi:alpha-aminoadipic semialdehyde synthase